jgi:general secretion pathway protein H
MARRGVTVKTPTSRTRTERRARLAARGFTLVELLVVLAIASLLFGLVPVAYSKMRESSQYRDLLRTTLADLRAARQMAQTQGHPVTYQVQLDPARLGIDGRSMRDVPKGMKLRATVGQNLLQQNTALIVFLPGGGATGGSIEIIRANGEGARLRVDWFSGQITQEKLLP